MQMLDESISFSLSSEMLPGTGLFCLPLPTIKVHLSRYVIYISQDYHLIAHHISLIQTKESALEMLLFRVREVSTVCAIMFPDTEADNFEVCSATVFVLSRL
jgi:hypothetical protein